MFRRFVLSLAILAAFSVGAVGMSRTAEAYGGCGYGGGYGYGSYYPSYYGGYEPYGGYYRPRTTVIYGFGGGHGHHHHRHHHGHGHRHHGHGHRGHGSHVDFSIGF